MSELVSAGAEAGDVRAAVDRVDVVGEGEDALGVAVVVLDARPRSEVGAVAPLDVDGPRLEHVAALVEVADEADQAALEVEASRGLASPRSSTKRIRTPLLR